MLSDRHCQLLSAYVDGELSQRQRKVAVRLLRRSSEARSLLRELKEDAKSIQDLPQHQLAPEFTMELLRRIGELAPASAAAPVLAGTRSFPAWLGTAAAAAVLLMVTTASYFFFANLSPRDNTQPVPIAKEKPHPKELDPLVPQIVQGTFARFGEPGMLMAVQDLGQEETQNRLAREFKKENAVHLELPCKNSAQAVAGIGHAFADNGIKLLVDPAAKAKLKANEPAETEILVYAENLSPDELTNILKQLGIQEKRRNTHDKQFASVRLDTMTNHERQRLSKILGVDAKQLQPAPLADLPTFIEAPQAQGGKAKQGKPDQKERFAMVMASNTPASSAEVQRFLRSRSAPRPGTLQVVLVVRVAAV